MARKNKGINIFRQVPKANLPRTTFNMSHQVKFSGEFGRAYPIFCQEVIPGDRWDISADHFARLAPMIAPVMHDLDVRMHWFFVPMRLLWDDFEDWMTGGRTGTWREDNPDSFPVLTLTGLIDAGFTRYSEFIGSLFDYMGFGFANTDESAWFEPASGQTISALPFRAYWLIYNYFFRDQNVQDEIPVSTASGGNDVTTLNEVSNMQIFDNTDCLFRVAWDKDYFTSATLTPQRGPQVYIPLGNSAPIVSTDSTILGQTQYASEYEVATFGDARPPSVSDLRVENIRWSENSNGTATGSGFLRDAEGNGISHVHDINLTKLSADLSGSAGAAVDDVREAFALERFFERMQIVGSRFSEFLRGIFGTNAGDARLQMPEYLGTWQNPFMINNVSQTSATTSSSPQAQYAGNGMSSQRNEIISKAFPEHGYLIGLYVAMPRNGYSQGLSKVLSRKDWLDFFNPYFEHIGEQPVMMSELYYDPSLSPNEDEIFGYQSQYADYKFINSHIHGQFKNYLNFWTASRIFDTKPTLSPQFVYFNKEESTDRVFALVDEPKFYVQLDIKAYATRSMSAYSTPRVI